MKMYCTAFMLIFVSLISSLIFISCKKDNSNARPGTPSFSWTLDGATFVADEATAFTNDIEARKTVGAEVKHVEVALHSANDFPVGTYTIGPAMDVIGCWDESNPSGTSLFSTSGTLTITASTPDEVNGNFSVMLSSGSTMTGTFSHVPLE